VRESGVMVSVFFWSEAVAEWKKNTVRQMPLGFGNPMHPAELRAQIKRFLRQERV